MRSSSREERTPTVNTKVEAVVPPWNRIGCRERTQKQTKKVATRFRTSVECRTRKRPTTTNATTHREAAPKRGQRRETACVPTCVDVGWRRRWRKKQATGEWNRPFSLRFPVFLYDFDCWQSEWMRRRRGRGTWLSQHTHTGRQGWARSARKVNEEGFFLLQKKSLEKDLEGARALFVFEVGESVRAV